MNGYIRLGTAFYVYTCHRLTLINRSSSISKSLLKKTEERMCQICKVEMEDKYRLLTVCSAYQEKRNVLLDNLRNEQLLNKNAAE